MPSPQCTVVKSIFAPFSIDWLVDRYQPRVVVIQRNPLGTVSSWLKLGISEFDLTTRPAIRDRYLGPLGIDLPPRGASQLVITAWTVGLLTSVLGEAVARHPEWLLVDHEYLCIEPQEKISDLYQRLGLTWNDAVDRYLAEADRPGDGLMPFRVTRDQPEQWRERLSTEEVGEIQGVLQQFPAKGWVFRPTRETMAVPPRP
jgi:hypothetical protein